MDVRIIRLVILVLCRFKLFLLVDSLIVIYQNWIYLVTHLFSILDSPSDNLAEPHPQIIELIILKVLRMVYER